MDQQNSQIHLLTAQPAFTRNLPRHRAISRAGVLGVTLLAGCLALAGGTAAGAVLTWDGGASGPDLGKWTVKENWGLVIPNAGDDLHFATASVTNSNDFAADTSFASITFDSGAGAFTLGGNRLTLAGDIADSSTTAQAIGLALRLGAPTHTVTTAAGAALGISGIISETGGARNLVKAGAGTLALTGANTFTGTTTIAASGGTLTAGAAGALGGTSGITVHAGGTLLLAGTGTIDRINDAAGLTLDGGALSMAGLSQSSETLGTLTLSANSSIDFGAGDRDTLRFSSLVLGGYSLAIYNWTGSPYPADATIEFGPRSQDRLLFSSDVSAQTLSQISFYSGGVGSAYLGLGHQVLFGYDTGYEIVPVPEPGTLLGALALLGLVAWREKRRFVRLFQA